MNCPTIAISLILAGSLSGCASAVPVIDFYDTDSDTLRRFQAITVLDAASANAKGLKKLAEVEGIYCNKFAGQASIDDHRAKAQAVDQLKLKAAKKAAYYITTPQCVIRGSGDFSNNCYSTVVCTSSAIGLID